MLIFVPPTVCGSLWHNCPGIWTPCWFYNIYKEQRTLLVSSSTLILSKVEPIFSRKWVWSQFLINLLLLENVLSPLIQSGSSRNQFIVGEFQTRRSAAPDSHRRHQTLAETRRVSPLSPSSDPTFNRLIRPPPNVAWFPSRVYILFLTKNRFMV